MRNLPLNRFLLAVAAVTAAVLLFWGGESLFHFARLCNVDAWLAWIPAVSTSGVMLLSTAIAMNKALDEKTRYWAGGLAAFGIVMDVSAAMGQHVIAMQPGPIHVDPIWGMVIGGLPPLMGGLLVHVISLVFGQHRREQAEAEAAQAAEAQARQAAIDSENQRAADESKARARRDSELAYQREAAAAAEKAAIAARQKAAAEQEIADATERRTKAARAVLQPEQERPHLVVDNTKGRKAAPPAPKDSSPVKSAAIAYLLAQHQKEGRDLADIGPTEIANAIKANPDTCKKSHRAWKAELAELMEAAG